VLFVLYGMVGGIWWFRVGVLVVCVRAVVWAWCVCEYHGNCIFSLRERKKRWYDRYGMVWLRM